MKLKELALILDKFLLEHKESQRHLEMIFSTKFEVFDVMNRNLSEIQFRLDTLESETETMFSTQGQQIEKLSKSE